MEALIPSIFYRIFFLVFISILTLGKIISNGNATIISPDIKSHGLIKIVLIGGFLVLFFGLRSPYDPDSVFADTSGYTYFYERVQDGADSSLYDQANDDEADNNSEFGFYLIRDTFAINGVNVSIWYLFVAAIYIFFTIWAIHKLFPNYEYLAFLFWLTSFGIYEGGINGIRNADACSIFLLGFSYFIANHRKVILGTILLLFAYFTHHAAGILIISFIGAYFFIKSTKSAVGIWILSIILSLLFGNTIANYIAALGLEDRMDEYMKISGNEAYMESAFAHVGFRWDFLLYSSIPIILGWYVTVVSGVKNRIYQILLNTYILANAVWIVFMYSAFTNRYAMLSWFLYGFILCYPILKFRIWSNQALVGYGLLFFQLLLTIVLS